MQPSGARQATVVAAAPILAPFTRFFHLSKLELGGSREGVRDMELLSDDVRKRLPPLYSQEQVEDPLVQVKFFYPDFSWTWYGIEFDGEDTFFGYVVGFEAELGYFSLSELMENRGKLGMSIERDLYFTPKPLSEVKKLHHKE